MAEKITDEEIEQVVSEFCSVLEGHRRALREIAAYYIKKGRQQVIEWGKERCFKHSSLSYPMRRKCTDCWVELEKEAEK